MRSVETEYPERKKGGGKKKEGEAKSGHVISNYYLGGRKREIEFPYQKDVSEKKSGSGGGRKK